MLNSTARSLGLCAFSVLFLHCKGEAKNNAEVPVALAPTQPKNVAKAASEQVATPAVASSPDDSCSLPARPLRRPLHGRLVAIGDIHGDLEAARRALRLAGAIDESDVWIGGTLTLVQTGDILDRGNDEQEILDLFSALKVAAKKAGGAVIVLNGNHELMNAMGDFRYVTRGGFADFVEGEIPDELTAEPRARAFFPGGRYAKVLAENDMVVVVGDSMFVHGGVLPAFIPVLEKANRDSRCFLLGELPKPPPSVVDSDGPLWTREFSQTNTDCNDLSESLDALGVKRMVVGHTPQLQGITSACGGKVWRIDTGMASYYQGPTEVLEITDGVATILK